MSAFEGSEWTQPEQVTQLAPGPAAFSANGNGPDVPLTHVGAAAFSSNGIPLDPHIWIAEAPPLAIFCTAAAGATLALIFVMIFRSIRGVG